MSGMARKAAVWSLIAVFTISPVLAQAQTSIGKTSKVVRQVEGALDANVRELSLQDNVYSNERINTGSDSAARLIFSDQTILSIGADSNVVLDRFVFDADPDKSTVALSMTKGVLRFVSGKLPKDVYQIRTPTALIGIRGTIFEVIVAANGATTVNVTEGAVAVSAGGTTASVSAGQTTSVAPGAGPTPPAPTPPAPPAVVAMNSALGPDPGIAGGTETTAEGGIGGLSTGAIAAGLAAAAALALGIVAITDDDDSSRSSSSSTSTSTSTATSTN